MHRRKFVASGVGLIAAAAGQGLVWTFNGMNLRAQPAVAPYSSLSHVAELFS